MLEKVVKGVTAAVLWPMWFTGLIVIVTLMVKWAVLVIGWLW